MHSSKVYARLTDSLGLSDHPAVLNVMLAKMAKNLQVSTLRYRVRVGARAVFSVMLTRMV